MAGIRRCFAKDFTDIYVFDLRGNVRAFNKEEGGNIFNVMVPVAITLLVKNPNRVNRACQIHYHDVGIGLRSTEKLSRLQQFKSIENVQWSLIMPNEKEDWINQRGEEFDKFISLGNKKDKDSQTIFCTYSLGVATDDLLAARQTSYDFTAPDTEPAIC